MSKKIWQRVLGGVAAGAGQYLGNVATEQRQMRGVEQRMAYERQLKQEDRDFRSGESDEDRAFRAAESQKDRDAANERAAGKSGRKIIKGADGYQYYQDSGERVLPDVTASPAKGTPTPLSKLMAEREALAPDDPNRATYDAAIAKATTSPALTDSEFKDRATRKRIEKLREKGTPGAMKAAARLELNLTFGKPDKGLEWTEDGKMVPVEGGRADKMTDTQGKAALFADRVQSTEDILMSEDANGNPIDLQGTSLLGGILSVLPGGNYAQSPDRQKYEQAQRNFINSVLRRESGSVINLDEFDNAEKQYFPQLGDTLGVTKQKRKNRKDALTGLKRDAGPRYREELKKRGKAGRADAGAKPLSGAPMAGETAQPGAIADQGANAAPAAPQAAGAAQFAKMSVQELANVNVSNLDAQGLMALMDAINAASSRNMRSRSQAVAGDASP